MYALFSICSTLSLMEINRRQSVRENTFFYFGNLIFWDLVWLYQMKGVILCCGDGEMDIFLSPYHCIVLPVTVYVKV